VVGNWGYRDASRAPILTLFLVSSLQQFRGLLLYLVQLTGWHLVIMPAIVCFMLIGPFLAAGLYDVSWELEKNSRAQFVAQHKKP